MRALARAADYYELSKPRIIALLLVTTAAAMVMAARGIPPPALLFWTLLAGALAAASAGALNCVWDADIDRVMKRTQSRPIPAGRISRRDATIYALAGGRRVVRDLLRLGQSARGVALAGRQRLLRRRLHDVAQAHHAAQHRRRRRGGVGAAARRVGRGDAHDRRARRSASSR